MAQDLRADATVGAVTFADRLADAVDRKRSQLVVGLDPPAPLLPGALRGDGPVDPVLPACRRFGTGIFCLVKTSNAGGADIQDLALSDGRQVWQHVAELVAAWGEEFVGERGLSSVGAGVGATEPP